jgi:hypothetical protein
MTPGILASRKYVLTLLIFFAATVICLLPPIVSMFILGKTSPLTILSGTEWTTVMGMLCAFYFGANVAQKHILKQKPGDVDNTNNTDDSVPAPAVVVPPQTAAVVAPKLPQ